MGKIVKLLSMNSDGVQSVMGTYSLDQRGHVVFTPTGQTAAVSGEMELVFVPKEIKAAGGQYAVPKTGEDYLTALQYHFSGTVVRATAPQEG